MAQCAGLTRRFVLQAALAGFAVAASQAPDPGEPPVQDAIDEIAPRPLPGLLMLGGRARRI